MSLQSALNGRKAGQNDLPATLIPFRVEKPSCRPCTRVCSDLEKPAQSLATYTAAEIGRAAGISKRNILSTLAPIPPSGTKIASGNSAASWALLSLPPELTSILKDRASQHGFKSIAALLESPVEPWSPGPLSTIDPQDLEYAKRLQSVLRHYLAAQNDASADFSGLKESARIAHAREFGRPVKARQIDRLIEMVMERDRGFEQWQRVELFVPNRFQLMESKKPNPSSPNGFPLEDLAEAIVGISSSNTPSIDDRAMVWRAAVETFFILEEIGHPEQRLKKELRKYLLIHAPWIGSSDESLKKGLNAKITLAREQGLGAVGDSRKSNSGNFRKQAFEEDQRLFVEVAHLHQGKISLAHRLLIKGFTHPTKKSFLQFSEAYRDYCKFDPRKNKSQVPKFMRDAIRPQIESIKPYRYGPRAVKAARPSRLRDWSNVRPNDWHTSDDETANSMVYWLDPNGPYECEALGRFDVGRPQILPLYDVASEMPLSLLVSPSKGYSADSIRDLIVPAWLDERIGMPFKGCQFERGIWKARHVKELVSWSEIDGGFAERNISLKIRHATTPKAKTIERIFSSEQDRTSAFPGYIGRGEKGEHFERVHRFVETLKKIDQRNREPVDPREKLWSLETFQEELLKVMRELAAEPQNGERFRGRSPEEVWQEGIQGARPHQVLPPNLQYLLATKQVQKKVSSDGIILTVGGCKYQFTNSKELGMLQGERVNIRYRGRVPEYIIVTHPKVDPKGLKPFVVPLRQRLDAMDATKEDFDRARQEENNFTAGARALIRVIAPRHGLTVEDSTLGTRDLRSAGDSHRIVETFHREMNLSRDGAAKKANKLSRRLGLDTSGVDPRKVVESLDGIDDLERQIRETEAAERTFSSL